MSRKSIFDLERRITLPEEYANIVSTIKGISIVLECIKTWPYRQASSDIESYANKLGFSAFQASSDDDMLYSMELFLNLLHWVPEHESKTRSPLEIGLEALTPSDIACKSCIEDIEWVLEKINMHVRENNDYSTTMYTIGKRDVDVDAVIEMVPDLSEQLLSYLDVRNQKDETVKRGVLKAIADYLEPKRKKYNGTPYSGLCDDLFVVFNKCSIRHSKDQWKLRKIERMKIYDQAFKASIHLIQAEEIKQFKDNTNELKQRFEQKR